VQRLFSMFPTGLPGVALLLLRASAAVALLTEIYLNQQHLAVWIQASAVLISLVLSAGYLTPIVVIMGLLLHGVIWAGSGVESTVWAAVVSLDGIALALLGPGAYSVDSYLFGRRVVVLPPS
jgi:hypothetical protein